MKKRKRLSLSSKARSALAWAAVFFVLLQLAGSLLFDHVWTSVRFPSAAQVVARLDRKPDIVFLGSSRFGTDVNETEIGWEIQQQRQLPRRPEVLNASVPAGDLIAADYLLDQILRHGARPKLAVIEVSPETLNRFNEWFFFHVRRQVRWVDTPALFVDICRSKQLGRLLSARLVPWHVHRRQIWTDAFAGAQACCSRWFGAEVRKPSAIPFTAAAQARPAIDWEEVLRKARSRPDAKQLEYTQIGVGQPLRWLKNYRIGGASVHALERLIDRCRQHEIEVVLVGVPVSAPHRQTYTPPIDSAFVAHMKKVSQAHQCRFVDYRDQVPDALFNDNHHMRPEGAIYFSRRLSQEVLAPAWTH